MLINLSEVLQTTGKEEIMDIANPIFSFHNGLEEYSIKETSPLSLQIINKEKGKAIIKGKLSFHVDIPCDRCLKPVDTLIEVDIEREVFAPELLEDNPEQAEDQEFIDGYQLITESLLQEEIMMNWPLKTLCKEDCKGICKMCGKDLNEGECGCDTFVPDPRMAAIADLFK